MRLKEYLNGLNESDQVTFIIAKAVKDERSPFYHTEYKTTPMKCVWEWSAWEDGHDYIIANENHPPIDITGTWVNWYNRGDLKCSVIISEETLRTLYKDEQAERMIKFYDK